MNTIEQSVQAPACKEDIGSFPSGQKSTGQGILGDLTVTAPSSNPTSDPRTNSPGRESCRAASSAKCSSSWRNPPEGHVDSGFIDEENPSSEERGSIPLRLARKDGGGPRSPRKEKLPCGLNMIEEPLSYMCI